MKKIVLILFILILLLIPTSVGAHYKPSIITDREDLVYFIRYYNGSKSKVDKKIVILQEDLNLGKNTINFYLKKSLTIDLNGYKIISKGNKPCINLNGDKKLLTIINSKNDMGYLKSSYNTIKVNSGNLILNNIKVLSTSKKYNGIYIQGGKVKTINSKVSSKNNAIYIKHGYFEVNDGFYKGLNYGLTIDGGKAIINEGKFAGFISGLKLNDFNAFHLKKGEFMTLDKKNSIKEKSRYLSNDLFVSSFIYHIGNN